MRFIDLTGQRFGKLVVIERTTNIGKKVAWVCQCDCGNTHITTSSCLKQGDVKSCGCLNYEPTNYRHGHSKEFISITYFNMKTRCLNPNNKSYKNYGGRGITICAEWLDSFQAFYDHVSNLPHYGEKGYSLDRIDNDGNYEPGNVRWATAEEQSNNRRCTKKKG